MKTYVRRYYVLMLFQKQGGRCCYCDRFVTISHLRRDQNKPDVATLEHLITGRRHGWTRPDNLAMACRECNGMRGSAMDWLTFKSWRRGEFYEFLECGRSPDDR
ncbi:HNH endonuclease [Rhizobium sp. 2YAF20]|uniref:HNH endonuclease n=1 Tax=Rhizobium sp. 2YAF20 TaxID=3233027 RepID=UPI003F958D32